MWGLCLGQKRAKFLLFLLYHCFYLFEMFQNLTKISWETNRLLNYWSHVGAMFGPFWTILDHVWPSFPFRPARALKFSRLGKYGLCKISRLPIDLKCLRLSHYNLSEAYVYGVILFETISMLFLDCSRTMLTLLLLPDQLKHINFEDWVNMV